MAGSEAMMHKILCANDRIGVAIGVAINQVGIDVGVKNQKEKGSSKDPNVDFFKGQIFQRQLHRSLILLEKTLEVIGI